MWPLNNDNLSTTSTILIRLLLVTILLQNLALNFSIKNSEISSHRTRNPWEFLLKASFKLFLCCYLSKIAHYFHKVAWHQYSRDSVRIQSELLESTWALAIVCARRDGMRSAATELAMRLLQLASRQHFSLESTSSCFSQRFIFWQNISACARH